MQRLNPLNDFTDKKDGRNSNRDGDYGDKTQEYIAERVLDCAFEVHSHLGPGLLESTYQICLLYELQQRGLFVEAEKPMSIIYKSQTIECGYRIDILVEKDKLIIENKAVQVLNDLHMAQILSYMRLSGITLGFLFNFNVRHFKDGFKRVVLQNSLKSPS
jgi:GxxExxY protein